MRQITTVIKESELDISRSTLQQIVTRVTEKLKQQVVDQSIYQKMIYST